jgi:hypothetical protein
MGLWRSAAHVTRTTGAYRGCIPPSNDTTWLVM